MSVENGCLIFAMPQDVHSYAVGWATNILGMPTRYLYTSDLPELSALKFTGDSQSGFGVSFQCAISWDTKSTEWHQPADFRSVWFRRSRRPLLRPDLGAGDRRVAENDWTSVLPALELTLQDQVPLCINPPRTRTSRSLKCYHLRLAVELGLEIPPSLITNDPIAIRNFVDKHTSQVSECIAKPLNLPSWQGGSGLPHVFTTAVITCDDLIDSDLRSDPIILQRKIEKQFEVRITKIGIEFIAVRIDSQSTDDGKLDFRRHRMWKDFGHEPITVPHEIAGRLTKLCQVLGLVFCTIDFIVDPTGRWIFLEVNHMGNWLWIELYNPEIRLLDRMAQLLASGDPNFKYQGSETRISLDPFMDYYEKNKFEIAAEEAKFHPNNVDGVTVSDG